MRGDPCDDGHRRAEINRMVPPVARSRKWQGFKGSFAQPETETARGVLHHTLLGGMLMLVPAEPHQYGGTWVLYAIMPLILCCLVASFWLIVKGAIGVFGRPPRGEPLSTIPANTESSSRTAAEKRYRTVKRRTPQGERAAPALARSPLHDQ